MISPLTGALLAGGQSRRMGRDKCLLEVDGVPLWRRQLALLRALSADVLVISPEAPAWLPGEARWLPDAVTGRGPLGGLAAALAGARHDLVLTLAVDLPALTPDYLRTLAAQTAPGRGVVPELDALFQPLAAIYPRVALPFVEQHLGEPDRSFQHLIRDLAAHDLVRPVPVSASERPLFRNLNHPTD